jgi:hypothetical protein
MLAIYRDSSRNDTVWAECRILHVKAGSAYGYHCTLRRKVRRPQYVYPHASLNQALGGSQFRAPPLFIVTGMRPRCPLRRIRGLQLHSRSGLPTLWHVYPKWHAERFPWHAAFTAVPVFFISFARPPSLCCAEHVYIYTHICPRTDCILITVATK